MRLTLCTLCNREIKKMILCKGLAFSAHLPLLALFLCPLAHGQERGLQFLNHPDYIAGKGYGESPAAARQAALGEVAAFFTAKVATETREMVEVSDSKSSSRMRQETFVSTQTELFSVRYGEPYYLEGQKLWECVAYINRREAWEIYRQKFVPLVETFASLYRSGAAEADDFSQLLSYSRALDFAHHNNLSAMQAFAAALYPAGAAVLASSLEGLAELESQIRQTAARCSVSVVCHQDSGGLVRGAVSGRLEELGLAVAEGEAATVYRCDVTVEENVQQLTGGTFYTPEIRISIDDGRRSVHTQSISVRRVGARNPDVARQRAYKAMAEEVKKSFLAD